MREEKRRGDTLHPRLVDNYDNGDDYNDDHDNGANVVRSLQEDKEKCRDSIQRLMRVKTLLSS